MADKLKTFLALIFFALGVTLPLIGVATTMASMFGWIKTEAWVGIALAVATLLLFFLIGVALLASVKDLSWLTVILPFLFSALYTWIPDLIPFSIDDAAAMTAGAIFSAFLAIRKNPNAPRWVALPLIGAAIYTFFGGALPGPIDEMLVDILAVVVAVYGANQGNKEIPNKN
ncbi:MAG TPA: hypothetical protein PK530_20775 [Anaerolineales bacterium]|nr:hypothetical protein [Anaerolineales bacterium]